MVVGSISATGPGCVLEEGLIVVEARLVVRDVARLPRRGQGQLRLLLRVEREIRAQVIEISFSPQTVLVLPLPVLCLAKDGR